MLDTRTVHSYGQVAFQGCSQPIKGLSMLAHTSSQETIAGTSSKFCNEHHFSRFKLAIMAVFAPQKSANTKNKSLEISYKSKLQLFCEIRWFNIHHHTIGCYGIPALNSSLCNFTPNSRSLKILFDSIQWREKSGQMTLCEVKMPSKWDSQTQLPGSIHSCQS